MITWFQGVVPLGLLSACWTKCIAWCLRHPIREMLTGPSYFTAVTHESQFLIGSNLKRPCAMFWHNRVSVKYHSVNMCFTHTCAHINFLKRILTNFWIFELSNFWTFELVVFYDHNTANPKISWKNKKKLWVYKCIYISIRFTKIHNSTWFFK